VADQVDTTFEGLQDLFEPEPELSLTKQYRQCFEPLSCAAFNDKMIGETQHLQNAQLVDKITDIQPRRGVRPKQFTLEDYEKPAVRVEDIEEWMEDTNQYHLPFHNYAGPGTRVQEQILSGKLPVTGIDAAALVHDIEYLTGIPQTTADNQMWLNLMREYPFNPAIATTTKLAFLAKDLVGYDTQTNEKLGLKLYNHVRKTGMLDGYNSKFNEKYFWDLSKKYNEIDHKKKKRHLNQKTEVIVTNYSPIKHYAPKEIKKPLLHIQTNKPNKVMDTKTTNYKPIVHAAPKNIEKPLTTIKQGPLQEIKHYTTKPVLKPKLAKVKQGPIRELIHYAPKPLLQPVRQNKTQTQISPLFTTNGGKLSRK